MINNIFEEVLSKVEVLEKGLNAANLKGVFNIRDSKILVDNIDGIKDSVNRVKVMNESLEKQLDYYRQEKYNKEQELRGSNVDKE